MLCLFQTTVVHGDMRNFLHSEHNNQRMLQKPSAFESVTPTGKTWCKLAKKQKKQVSNKQTLGIQSLSENGNGT